MSIHPFLYLSINPFLYLSIHLFICLSLYLCIHVSICASICVSIHHQHSLCLAFPFAYLDNTNHNRCLSDSSCYTSYCMLSLIGAAVEGISLPIGTRTFNSSSFSTFCTSILFFLYLLHLYALLSLPSAPLSSFLFFIRNSIPHLSQSHLLSELIQFALK